MGYIKTLWQARLGVNLNKFGKEMESKVSVMLNNNPDRIDRKGTPFSADNMNHIEQGIYDAHESVAAKQDKLTATGATNLLTAPAAAGGQPGTKPVSDFLQAPGAQTVNTQLLVAPATKGAAPTLKPISELAPANAALTAESGNGTDTATGAISSRSVADILQAVWAKIRNVVNVLTAHTGNTSNPHGITKAQVGLGSVTNDAQVKRSEMGAGGGVATLDANAKIPLAQLSDAILGQLVYGGNVVPSTGVATLTANAKTKLGTSSASITLTNNTTAITGYAANQGIYYIATAAGTFAGVSLETGDWLVSLGTKWDKVDNTDAVTGVKGNAETTYRNGNVNITKANIGLANVDDVKQAPNTQASIAAGSGTDVTTAIQNNPTVWGMLQAVWNRLFALNTNVNGKVTANTAITGATKAKITYDSKGLVTSGADLAASDIPEALVPARAKLLLANCNLNDYQAAQAGYYLSSMNITAQTIQNRPNGVDVAFTLEVIANKGNTVGAVQRLIPYSSPQTIYQRAITNQNEWTAWHVYRPPSLAINKSISSYTSLISYLAANGPGTYYLALDPATQTDLPSNLTSANYIVDFMANTEGDGVCLIYKRTLTDTIWARSTTTNTVWSSTAANQWGTFLSSTGGTMSDSKQSKVINATCDTAASTAAKVVTVSGYMLVAGDIFAITYTNGNTANSATINVNSAGAKQVRLGGGQPTAVAGTGAHYVAAGNTVLYYYNGTYMCQLGSTDITDEKAAVSSGLESARVVIPPNTTVEIDLETLLSGSPMGSLLYFEISSTTPGQIYWAQMCVIGTSAESPRILTEYNDTEFNNIFWQYGNVRVSYGWLQVLNTSSSQILNAGTANSYTAEVTAQFGIELRNISQQILLLKIKKF